MNRWSFPITPFARQMLGMDPPNPDADRAALRRETSPFFDIPQLAPAEAVGRMVHLTAIADDQARRRLRDLINLATVQRVESDPPYWILLAPSPAWDADLTTLYLLAANAQEARLTWGPIERPAWWPEDRPVLTVAEYCALTGRPVPVPEDVGG